VVKALDHAGSVARLRFRRQRRIFRPDDTTPATVDPADWRRRAARAVRLSGAVPRQKIAPAAHPGRKGQWLLELVRPRAPSAHAGRRAALAAAAGLFVSGTQAGTVLREVQVTAPDAPAATLRLVRQVLSEGDNCKILHEESTDPLAPGGTYILATAHDAFIVDPARATVTPVDPTRMLPATGDGEPERATVADVVLEREVDEPGPVLHGFDTRRFVYGLRYDVQKSGDAGAPVVVRHEERHEFYAAPWSAVREQPVTWRAWRISEDAGVGAGRREVREAMEALHRHGLILRHSIERRVSGAPDGPVTERISREVTSFARQELDARLFVKPEGFAPAEFLAPATDELGDPPPGGAGGASAGRN
jgi:hypothetical protein